MAIEGSVPPAGTIVPHLVVRDAQAAVDFYVRAFSAEVLYRSPSPSGEGEHVHLKIWESLIQLSTEEPSYRQQRMQGGFLASPETLDGSTCLFQIAVPDVDEAYQRAVDEGAIPATPPMDMFWGDRYGWVRDPLGHMWALCTVKEVITPRQAAQRMASLTQAWKEQAQ